MIAGSAETAMSKVSAGEKNGEAREDVLHLPSLSSLTLPVGVLASGPLGFLGDGNHREASAPIPAMTFHLRAGADLEKY